MQYFDAHCHVQFPQFDADRESVINAMRKAGIGGLVVGCDAASSKAAAELVDEDGTFFASVGQHPNDNRAEEYDEHLYRNLLMYPQVVAIGECGLDYYRPADANEEVKKRQKILFEHQIHLAGQTKRPLIVHARPSKGSYDAYHDATDMIRSAKKEFGDTLTGDFHFFVGNTEVAKKIFELDFTISYTAVITFARDYDEVIQYAPIERILTETDAPFVAPASRRGQRNDPLSVIEVVKTLAQIRAEDPEEVRRASVDNAKKLFKISVS